MSAEMEAELHKVQLWTANDYYNEIVAVTSRYEVKKLETDLINIMSTKVNITVFMTMILKHMEDVGNVDNLKELCNAIRKIQRLTKMTGKLDQGNINGGKET